VGPSGSRKEQESLQIDSDPHRDTGDPASLDTGASPPI
jgi:hypothetical protein